MTNPEYSPKLMYNVVLLLAPRRRKCECRLKVSLLNFDTLSQSLSLVCFSMSKFYQYA